MDSYLIIIYFIGILTIGKSDNDYGIHLTKDWYRLIAEKSTSSGFGPFILRPRAIIRCKPTDVPVVTDILFNVSFTNEALKYGMHLSINITKDRKFTKAIANNYMIRNGKLVRYRHMTTNNPCDELFMRLLKPYWNFNKDCTFKKGNVNIHLDDINRYAQAFFNKFYYIQIVLIDKYYTHDGVFLCIAEFMDLIAPPKSNNDSSGFGRPVEIIDNLYD